jgi:hypothetical protein
MVKGLAAGVTNLALALSLGETSPNPSALLAAALVGFLNHSASLTLLVLALRHLRGPGTSAPWTTRSMRRPLQSDRSQPPTGGSA